MQRDAPKTGTPEADTPQATTDPALYALAQAAKVQITYKDGTGTMRSAPAPALRRILLALGLPAATPEEARASLARLRAAHVAPGLPDVVVVWTDQPRKVQVRVPVGQAGDPIDLRVLFEQGGERDWTHTPQRQGAVLHAEGHTIVAHDVAIPSALPVGYHTLEVRLGEDIHRAHLLVAPPEAPRIDTPEWGLFVPTYALHRSDDHGIGDLGSLQRLAAWMSEEGGTTIATLPLLDTFLDAPIHDPSPYAPVSRRFWSPLLIDPTLEPEHRHPRVRRIHEDPDHRDALDALRDGAYVDHAQVWRLKSRLLLAMAEALEAEDGTRRRTFRNWVRNHPDVERYACFRAATARHGPWHDWPAAAQEGDLSDMDIDADLVRLHTYAQWVADGQVARIEAAGKGKVRLHLDLPLGAHADGYDTWNDRAAYATGIETGAPPDGFFEKGQKWGFQPLNPRRLRQSGYRHFAACLRHHLRHASVLRIDHVMSLHRLFWVPQGSEATDGAYVHYPDDELYAVVLIEAHRAGALIVGEDLGTVPRRVHEAMDRHHLHRTYVFQLQARTGEGRPPTPGHNTLSTLNTHDMVPFAAWWHAHDVTQRVERGFLTESKAASARAHRELLKARVLKGLRATLMNANPPAAGKAEEQQTAAGRSKEGSATERPGGRPDDEPPHGAERDGPPRAESTARAALAGDMPLSGAGGGQDADGGEAGEAGVGDARDATDAVDPAGPVTPKVAPGVALATARDIALRFLFRSPAALVIVNVEDLWFETAPQNQPGYGPDSPEGRRNWARRTRYPIERITQDPEIERLIQELAPLRPHTDGREPDA